MKQRSASAARPARKFPPSERVFHLVSGDDFERADREHTETLRDERGRVLSRDRVATEARTLREGARTTCCDKPAEAVYGVAISKASVIDVQWCRGAK